MGIGVGNTAIYIGSIVGNSVGSIEGLFVGEGVGFIAL